MVADELEEKEASLKEALHPADAGPGEDTVFVQKPSARPEGEKLVGTLFAQKYQITEFLGRGGMSVVYKARHLMMDKEVALKVLHSHLTADQLSVRRFKQEAQAASSLTHPGIVGIKDFGEDGNGTPFLVMDFIEGESLSQSIRANGPLDLERFLDIMQQVASALEHAHENGVVHRDLKPSNIMVTSSGGQETARIVDFGIAKIVSQGAQTMQQLTQTGELFGSPLYMSPEQCSGAPLDRRSDIYAFGCVMYEALTGKPPYVGESVFETINKQLNDTPPELVAPQLSAELRHKIELIILKALAKSPEDRYQNAAEIESQLRSISLSSRTGVFARLGGAWELANARRAARRKNKLPIIVTLLTSVSCLSMISMLCLLGAFIDSDYQAKCLSDSRKVITEYSLIQLDLGIMGRTGDYYVMKDRSQRALAKFKSTQEDLRRRLDKVKRYLSFDPVQQKQYVKRMPEMYALMDESWDVISHLGSEVELSSLHQGFRLKENEVKALSLLKDLSTEARSVDKQEARVEKSRAWVLVLSVLCVLMNAGVMISLLVYFARGTPKRLKELAANAARLSQKKRTESGDEIAELDLVLQELATALSEAEQREQALLSAIREKQAGEAAGGSSSAASENEELKATLKS